MSLPFDCYSFPSMLRWLRYGRGNARRILFAHKTGNQCNVNRSIPGIRATWLSATYDGSFEPTYIDVVYHGTRLVRMRPDGSRVLYYGVGSKTDKTRYAMFAPVRASYTSRPRKGALGGLVIWDTANEPRNFPYAGQDGYHSRYAPLDLLPTGRFLPSTLRSF